MPIIFFGGKSICTIFADQIYVIMAVKLLNKSYLWNNRLQS